MAQSSTFYLILTDGDENHVPGTTRKGPEYERAEDHGLEQKALSLFAKEMMRQPGRVITKGESERLSLFTVPATTENAHRVESIFQMIFHLESNP